MPKAVQRRSYARRVGDRQASAQRKRLQRELAQVERRLEQLRKFPPVRSENVPEAIISV